MSNPSASTLTATNPEVSSTGSAPVRKKKHVDIKQGLPKPWQKERSQRDTDILHASRELWKAKAKLEKANTEYKSALFLQKYYQEAALSMCVDVLLERLSEDDRRFLITEVVSLYRLCSDGKDVVIPREIIHNFIEGLIFRYM